MIRRIGHIGLATRSLRSSLEFFQKVLGMELETVEIVEEQRVQVGLLRVGETRIELLEAIDEDSPVGRFLARHGEGFHHLTLEVDDLDAELERLKALNVKLIDPAPRQGAQGRRIAFIHPHATGGVLIELSQPAGAAPAPPRPGSGSTPG
ncbi:MAG: methylmalonyl-CoA epimerase [Acidobacteria bacterium]|nr:methylmalonyl-CoA epimerase [Acidobacteriota bacterium]